MGQIAAKPGRTARILQERVSVSVNNESSTCGIESPMHPQQFLLTRNSEPTLSEACSRMPHKYCCVSRFMRDSASKCPNCEPHDPPDIRECLGVDILLAWSGFGGVGRVAPGDLLVVSVTFVRGEAETVLRASCIPVVGGAPDQGVRPAHRRCCRGVFGMAGFLGVAPPLTPPPRGVEAVF